MTACPSLPRPTPVVYLVRVRATPVVYLVGARATPVMYLVGVRATPVVYLVWFRATPVMYLVGVRATPVVYLVGVRVAHLFWLLCCSFVCACLFLYATGNPCPVLEHLQTYGDVKQVNDTPLLDTWISNDNAEKTNNEKHAQIRLHYL